MGLISSPVSSLSRSTDCWAVRRFGFAMFSPFGSRGHCRRRCACSLMSETLHTCIAL